ncbi:MAG: sigma-54-dependent transcriptional regulator [Dissulfuribacterales bacterium]
MKSSTILIIDDELAIRNGARLTLSEEGWSVDTCPTGTDGLNQALAEEYDVILLDIKLPDISGMEILKTIRLKQPDSYVIMMTGFATVQNAVEALKLGAYDYIAKPFLGDELILAVKKALENKHLKENNLSLRKQLYQRYDFNQIVGEHPRIQAVFEAIKRVAPTDSTVLLDGESGTGKELFAGSIHVHSLRASRQFIVADCSTFSASLLESELFGHVKGAFTGAVQNKAGIFEAADGGTLFLDEVANLSLEIQGKLLRVMETQEFKPVGASKTKKSDARIIAATNQDLKAMVEDGTFRQDLFYRMNVFPIFLPPLRERKEDIPRLAYHFLRFFCRKTGKKIDGFSDEALDQMVNHPWPGNVRQLKNVVERLVIMTDHPVVDYGSLQNHFEVRRNQEKDSVPHTLEELKAVKRHLLEKQFGRTEKAFLQKALDAENGNITRASKRVGMQRSNFSVLMKKHNIAIISGE